jgi:hypothetical protein
MKANGKQSRAVQLYLAFAFTLVSCLAYSLTLEDGSKMFLRNVG